MGKLKINGDLLLTGSISFQTPNCITPAFSAKVDSNGYGQNLLIGAGGNTVIGGGEGAQEFFAAAGVKDEENIYLAATDIHMYTDCNDIAKKKLVMSLNADGTITLPNSKKIDTDGTFSGNAAGIYRVNHFTTEAQVDSFQAPNTLQYCTIGAEYTPIGNDGILISAGWSSGRYGAQIWIDDGGGSGGMKIRSFGANNGANWNEWQTVLTSGNYNSYAPSLTGTGASGTWGISITGNASYASSAGHATYLNTVAGNEIRIHNATGLTNGGPLWLGWCWADGNKTVTKDWYIGNFSGGGLANVYASTFNGTLNGNASSANWASGATYANSIGSTGFGNGNFTYLQTDGEFYGATGWAHYLIANHGNGATYYNYVIKLPFWGVPQYKYQTGNTSAVNGWYDFITSENYTSYCAPASHSHSYLALSGGTLTGPLQVNSTIFGYNYANSNNAAAFIWDKNGSNYTGVGSCNTTDTIHFGPCNESGTWVSNYNQIWRFQGGVYAMGWLETDNYGSSAPGSSTPGYGRGGAIYYQV